jgi:hypothetical protein
MDKKWSGIIGILLVAGVSFAEEGRWSLSTDKQTGQAVAVLQSWSKRVLKVLPLNPTRVYSPVPHEEMTDKKLRKQAKRRGFKFTRLTAKNVSATPIHNGRILVWQEQTIVMPPQPEVQAGDALETKEGERQEPEDNFIFVTLFDDSGNPLWSRKFGPLSGRLPADRKAWDMPPGPETVPQADPASPKK